MELTVQNLYGLLLRSKLLSLEEAKAMLARWNQEAGENASNTVAFAAWMVAKKYLTEYQTTLLARGHADNFFLGEYCILDRLGKGRMAGVYKAKHRLGQIVAIKVLPPSLAKDGMLLARFHREAKLAMRLKHPNIVRTFQTGSSGGLQYLVMELLEGETLDELLEKRAQMPPAEAVRLTYQALLGLEHIHSHKLIHRDLKPANMMLVPAPPRGNTLDCTVKILDIGLGRVLFEEGEESVEDSGLTGEGVLLGTPDYMAPEQARDPRSADIRADIYSLGCVLYHLLAGQPPFPDTNIISQMIRHATEAPKPLNLVNAAVPDGLQQIVNWMMAKEPAQRYPTPARAAGALETFLAAGSTPASSPDFDPDMQPYLVWLDELQAAPAISPPPSSGAHKKVKVTKEPAVPPAVPPPPLATKSGNDPETKTKRMDLTAARKARRPQRPSPRRPKQKPADVELVPLAGAPTEAAVSFFGLQVRRREVVAFAAGVLGVVLAILFGWALAALFRNHSS
jgi:serine/threonine protein kinase